MLFLYNKASLAKCKYTLTALAICCTSVVYAKDQASNCSKHYLAQYPEQVLSCFIAKKSIQPNWKLIDTNVHDSITIYTYELTSQFWPDKSISDAGKHWKHKLTLYIPNQLQSKQALLFINGGTRFPEQQPHQPKLVPLDFIGIAKETDTLVADLQDIPNQYLRFDDGIARREDGIMAYTWNQYMDDPAKHAFWSAHLPMTKAVVVAMDVIQQEAENQQYPKPEHFALSGASKRGWAAWLATLADQRVNAIIPIVIDILNTKQNLLHIKNSLEDWPLAFRDYVQQGVTKRIGSSQFSQLMKIEDPITYLSKSQYKARLSIPKYIINASSDDFFVPDSLNQYIDYLPGETVIRIVPNQRHYIDFTIAGKALKNYYKMIVDNAHRPTLHWHASKDNHQVKITTRFKPTHVKLWQAYNPEKRDFRISSNIKYAASPLQGECKKRLCVYELPTIQHKTGYVSRFVEFSYQKGEHSLVTTSPAFITPNRYN
ncbi:PhoPQ-activated protein PqaA family protein [Spartinivicinus poritis]|uniref:PhoPQ-activated protein PqaA family protein n=1 Tax=Spartinivicinus poritis TaxID=2994640 RepID=A0ABT5U938_9GAMM|nr:PhoPQ-activated protein PqaA family protein [Spartinivicinus sp. A2-2]MDE1462892.1 PhoPQ-activated protein PqaA family protein [Spartinivicinus sp. A2-2]